MASRLSIYKGALLALGERTIESLSEDTPARYELDVVWDLDGVKRCLEEGFWKFALRTVKLTYDTSITTAFGFSRAFQKDNDFIRTAGIYSDEYLQAPLTHYADELRYIYCDLDTIYFQYVSDHVQFGRNYGSWPETFSDYVHHHFAAQACERITGGRVKKEDMEKKAHKLLVNARSKDAMEGPVKFAPVGSWVRSRSSGNRSTRSFRHQGM